MAGMDQFAQCDYSPCITSLAIHTMAQSYKQIQKQIQALQAQAEKLRGQEVKGVVQRIKVAIDHYGLTAAQLGFGASGQSSTKTTKAAGPGVASKYSDGPDKTWSGRGPRPRWLRTAIESGRKLEEFASGTTPLGQSKGAAKKPTTKTKSKRKSGTLYRDQVGNSWTGMGPKPRWLKEALASGQTLEQLTA